MKFGPKKMKLRYHAESKISHVGINLKSSSAAGTLILELEPQVRSVYAYDYNTGINKMVRLPFPHVIFVIKYRREDKNYFYDGVSYNGLRVFGSLSPLKKTKDKIFLLPTDIERQGTVCTNHAYDRKQYKSIYELANEVINLWFGHSHHINMAKPSPGREILLQDWQKTTPKDLRKLKWSQFGFNQPKAITNEFFEIIKHEPFYNSKIKFWDRSWSKEVDNAS